MLRLAQNKLQGQIMTHNSETAFGWFHTYEDYLDMFKLSESDLKKNIVVYPADISNFAHRMSKKNNPVICIDEKYHHDLTSIVAYINQRESDLNQKLNLIDKWKNKDQIKKKWSLAIHEFISDYETGKRANRYQCGNSDFLLNTEQKFDLALCPKCPFQDKKNDHQLPLNLIRHLCQAARRVRIFVNISDLHSVKTNLGPIMVDLQQSNYGIEFSQADVNSPNSSTALLEVWSRECQVNH